LPPDGADMNARVPWVLVENLEGPGSCRLDEMESRHLRKVLRKRVGDPVMVTDGRGTLAEASIEELQRLAVMLNIHVVERRPRPKGPEILLGILHGRAMDWAVQKSVELGVDRLVPLRLSRCQAADRAGARLPHWRLLARQALKQCHRVWEMEIAPPADLEEILRDPALPGFLAEVSAENEEVLEGVAARMLIGPEGGLSGDEKRMLLGAGWQALSLGSYVLRAETAVLAGAVFLGRRREDDGSGVGRPFPDPARMQS